MLIFALKIDLWYIIKTDRISNETENSLEAKTDLFSENTTIIKIFNSSMIMRSLDSYLSTAFMTSLINFTSSFMKRSLVKQSGLNRLNTFSMFSLELHRDVTDLYSKYLFIGLQIFIAYICVGIIFS